MSVIWQYVPSYSLQKGIIEVEALPDGPDDYEESEFFDLGAPKKSRAFRCEGMTGDEYRALEAAVGGRNVVYSLTDQAGVEWTGLVDSLTGQAQIGADYVNDIELVMRG